MASSVTAQQIETFFQELSKRYTQAATLYLIGGSALTLLGNRRPTQDIDYVGIDIPGLWTDLQRAIDQLAKETKLDIEAAPYLEMGVITSPDFWFTTNRVFGGRFLGFALWFNGTAGTPRRGGAIRGAPVLSILRPAFWRGRCAPFFQ